MAWNFRVCSGSGQQKNDEESLRWWLVFFSFSLRAHKKLSLVCSVAWFVAGAPFKSLQNDSMMMYEVFDGNDVKYNVYVIADSIMKL